jgi:hypothetical protein
MRDDNTIQSPVTYNLAEPLAIVLTLAQWNAVHQLLTEAPWKTADPIIRNLTGQIAAALAPRELKRAPNTGPQTEQQAA